MLRISILTAVLATSATVATAQFRPSEESLTGLYPGKTYSPYAQRAFPSRVFWGDTHLHTGLSMDAGLFGNTTSVDIEKTFRMLTAQCYGLHPNKEADKKVSNARTSDTKAGSDLKNAERVVVPAKKAFITVNDKLTSAKNQKMPTSAIKELSGQVGTCNNNEQILANL